MYKIANSTLKNDKSGKTEIFPKQAVEVGLSEAREWAQKFLKRLRGKD